MARLCDPILCSGCTACASVCPYDCISMKSDAEGFRRPVVDTARCVECGLCSKACPVLNTPSTTHLPLAYAVKNKDEAVRSVSTSGGVFTLLAEHILAQGGVVFGAAYDADFRVEHRMVESPQMLSALRGAKYAQSDLGDSFRQVKQQLALGKKVLFSGTPCQVSGLRAFLGKDEPNLLLVDLVCHGVPSPAVWAQYLSWRSEQIADGHRPVSVNVRSKDSGWANYSVDIRWPYGRNYLAVNREDPFIRAFVGDLCLRPSCHRCSAKGLNRCSDFTLGDYWGVGEQMPAMHDNRGTSIVLVHSDKAKTLWDKLSAAMTVRQADARRCMDHNPSALQSAKYDAENRSSFMHRYSGEDFAALVDELLPKPAQNNSFASRLKRLLKI